MKAFFISGSIFFTALILILAFENIGATCNGFLFLFTELDAPFFTVLGLATIGFITGIFYTGLVTTIVGSSNQEEEPPGNEW